MIYVFLANGCEEIEALAPVDLLRRADCDVCTVGISGKTITGSHGISIVCDITEHEAVFHDLEMVVLPGGMPGTLHLEKSQMVCSAIEHAVKNGKWIAAICAAPSILGHMGLLRGRKAVCFPGFEEQLEAQIVDEDVCVDGNIITARGMGVAVDFGLKLVELLTGSDRAQALRDSLQCSR